MSAVTHLRFLQGESAGTCSDHQQAIEDQVCKQEHYDQTINTCEVTCKSPARSLHSLSARNLQATDFDVLLSFICDTSTMDCYDRDVIEAIAAEIYTQATDALDALQTGENILGRHEMLTLLFA